MECMVFVGVDIQEIPDLEEEEREADITTQSALCTHSHGEAGIHTDCIVYTLSWPLSSCGGASECDSSGAESERARERHQVCIAKLGGRFMEKLFYSQCQVLFLLSLTAVDSFV